MHRRGFTIVELLIVIVVIAILVAIAIVSYNNIQERAYNTRIVTMVRQYVTAIEQYRIYNGGYPATGPEDESRVIAVVCLGQGYTDEYCGMISGVETYEDEVFSQRIRTIIGSTPQVNSQLLPAGPEEFVGAVYGIDRITTQAGEDNMFYRTIQYALHGANADCGLPGFWAYRRVTEPRPTTSCILELEAM